MRVKHQRYVVKQTGRLQHQQCRLNQAFNGGKIQRQIYDVLTLKSWNMMAMDFWCVWTWGIPPNLWSFNGWLMERQCHKVPLLPRKWNVNVTKCHACHANGTSMSPSATPATWMERQCHQEPRLPRNGAAPGRRTATKRAPRASQAQQVTLLPRKWNGTPSATPATQSGAAPRATNGDQARHQSQPSATSATPAMQMERQCHQVPRLPHEWNVNVTKSHACNGAAPGRLTATKSATRASQAQQVPRLPRQWNVNVTKCHACHANGMSMSPRATPATQSGVAPQVTNGDQARQQSRPNAKCHACHANGTSMSRSATPAAQLERQCHQVPRLPREWNVNVTKCHACNAQWRGAPGD